MTDPVVLPDSSVTVDRSTIERHLSIQVGGELAVGMASQSRMHGKGPGKKEGGGHAGCCCGQFDRGRNRVTLPASFPCLLP